jgi:hypothetical protein
MHYYNSYGAIMDTLDNIILAQYMLAKYNTPYTMISMGNLFEMEASIEAIRILLTNKGDYTTIKTNNILNNTPKESDYDNINSTLQLIDFSKSVEMNWENKVIIKDPNDAQPELF